MERTRQEQYKMPLYKLKKDIPCAKAGTIFYYDAKDKRLGSIAEGCLKMAWTKDGDCQNALCADTIVFHVEAIRGTDWFEKISADRKFRYTPSEVEWNGERLYYQIEEDE